MVEAQKIKYAVFIVLIFLIIATVLAVLANIEAILANLIWIVILAIFLFIIWKFDFLILLTEYERAVIFRFGKIKRVGGPGWTILIPVIENYVLVDLRVQTLDVERQDVITKDSIELRVDAVIYLHVNKDPQSVINSVIEVEDYKTAVRLYVISSIRDTMGGMELSEIIANIEALNQRLKESARTISRYWGIIIDAVEIKDVDIPKVVIEAMHEQKAAVQEKLARMEKADAHKAEIEAVQRACTGISPSALSYFYIKALEEMAKGQGTKIYFPLELSKLAESLSGRLGKGITKSEKEYVEEIVEPYKSVIEEFIDKAVKRAREKEGKSEDEKISRKNK